MGVSTSFSLYRSLVVGALSSASTLHGKFHRTHPDLQSSSSSITTTYTHHNDIQQLPAHAGLFHRVLDHYTNMSIATVNHGFSLAELFTLATFHLTSRTVKFSLGAANATVHTIDGVFGSTETSRAISAFVQLVRRELSSTTSSESGGGLSFSGTINAILTLGSISKALTAYACLQFMTQSKTEASQKRVLRRLYDGFIRSDNNRNSSDIGSSNNSNIIPAKNSGHPSLQLSSPALVSSKLITAFENKNLDRNSSVKVKWFADSDNVTRIEIEEEEEEEQRQLVNGNHLQSDHYDNSTDLLQASRLLRNDIETLDNAQMLISEYYFNQDQLAKDNNITAPTFSTSSSPHNQPLIPKRQIRHRPSLPTILQASQTASSKVLETLAHDFSNLPIADLERTLERSASASRRVIGDGWKKLFSNSSSKSSAVTPSSSSIAFSSSSVIPLPISHDEGVALMDSRLMADGNKRKPEGLLMLFDSTSSSETTPKGLRKRRSTIKLRPSVASSLSSMITAASNTANHEQTTVRSSPTQSQHLERSHHYPHPHMLKNIERYIRFASGSYGRQFMQLLGIGRVRELETSDESHPDDHYAFSLHTGIPLNCIVLSSLTQHHHHYQESDSVTSNPSSSSSSSSSLNPKIKPAHFYIVLDHFAKSVVVVFRGTLGLSDILTDLMCDYAGKKKKKKLLVDAIVVKLNTSKSLPLSISLYHFLTDLKIGNDVFKVHSGILNAASTHAQANSPLALKVAEQLNLYPGYGLIVSGHSLGAGVASLLSLLWSEKREVNFVTKCLGPLPSGRRIHCYAYGSPCVVSYPLSQYSQGLVTSVIHGDDIVCAVSIGHVRDLRRASVFLLDGQYSEQIIGKAMGLSSTSSFSTSSNKINTSSDEDSKWFWNLKQKVQEAMDSEKLYPPGDVYWIHSSTAVAQVVADQPTSSPNNNNSGGSNNSPQHLATIHANRVQIHLCEDVRVMFGEPRFTKRMITDHSPASYEETIELLVSAHFRK